jgi:hypothetical protein
MPGLPTDGFVRRKPRIRLLLVALATATLTLGGAAVGSSAAAGATSTTSIEGIWSFDNGQIAVVHASNGTFEGKVVAETKFAECGHPVGQEIWVGMTAQSDGSFWGLHQWYLGECQENPLRGPTAWRVLEKIDGSHYLRVCFSHPGTSQPTIAADGAPKEASEYAAYHVTYGCTNSALTARLPVAPGSGKSRVAGSIEHLTLRAGSAKKCLSARLFKIHLADPKYDPLKKVTVTLRGHAIATSRKGNYVVATINLRGLPKSAFTIKVHATTVLGHHLSAERTYHTCIRKSKRSSKRRGEKG